MYYWDPYYYDYRSYNHRHWWYRGHYHVDDGDRGGYGSLPKKNRRVENYRDKQDGSGTIQSVPPSGMFDDEKPNAIAPQPNVNVREDKSEADEKPKRSVREIKNEPEREVKKEEVKEKDDDKKSRREESPRSKP